MLRMFEEQTTVIKPFSALIDVDFSKVVNKFQNSVQVACYATLSL
jgi:hypothetical protein